MGSKTKPAPPSATLSQGRFVRSLGSVETLVIGFGAMIGFSWIVMSGDWLTSAGAFGAALAFVIGGAMMALVGLVYSELVAAMPVAGGEHNYLLRGLGPRLAFIGSWGIVGGYVTVVAFEAVAIPRVVTYIIPQVKSIPMWTVAGSEVYLVWALVGTATALLLALVNIRGVKVAGLLQTSITLFLVVMVLALIVGAFFGGEAAHAEPLFTGGMSGMISVLVLVPFLFVGFDVIPQSAEEVNLPQRKIGRIVILSIGLAAAFYLAIVFTTAVAMPAADLEGSELATPDAMGELFGGRFGSIFGAAGGLAGLLTTWNAMIIGASRLMWAMATSGMLPRWFAKLHPKYGTPVNAILFIAVVSMIAPFFGEVMLGWLVDSGSPNIVITYLMVSIVFVVLRKREPSLERPMKVGGRHEGLGIGVGIAAIVTIAGMIAMYLPGMPAFLAPEPWIMFGVWWALGAVFMFRIPHGIRPGADAEDRLLAALAKLGRGPMVRADE